VTVVGADVRQLPDRPLERHGIFDVVIAGAAASAAPPGSSDADPANIAASIVADAQHAVRAAAGGRLLLLSSGAVYGRGPTGPVAEPDPYAPDPTDPGSAYGQAKRLAETLGAVATAAGETEAVSARIFTLLGPGLPLDAHFAAGNVLRDVLAQQPIVLRGDGTAIRSYLYAGDLVVWLWRLLAEGRPGQAYNVGSPEPVTIRALAEQAARLAEPPVPVVVEGRPGLASCYLPHVGRAAGELGLAAWTALPEALARTLAYSRD
jgi:dTDP-glucose 4,6-dehydratase